MEEGKRNFHDIVPVFSYFEKNFFGSQTKGKSANPNFGLGWMSLSASFLFSPSPRGFSHFWLFSLSFLSLPPTSASCLGLGSPIQRMSQMTQLGGLSEKLRVCAK